MKQTNYIIALLLALFFATAGASADVVDDYKVDFNAAFSTSAHDFKVAPGWGHIVGSYNDYYDSYYVEYTYGAEYGVDNTGGLKIGSQTLGYGYESETVNDLLVTPFVTGTSSLYVKKSGSTGSVKFFIVTKSGASYTKGSQIDVDMPELSASEWTKVDIPEQEGGAYIGIRGENVYIDNFEAQHADVVMLKSLKIDRVTSTGKSEPDCNADGKFAVGFTVSVTNNGDAELVPGTEGYSLSIVNHSDNDAVVYTLPIAETLAVGASATVELAADVDYATYPGRNRYDVMENLASTSSYGSWIEPTPYAPVMQLRDESGRMEGGESYSYGMAAEPVSKKFTIRNTGAAPLTVTDIELPQGFSHDIELPLTVAAHGEAEMNITLNTGVAGIFSGNVVVKGDGVDDFTFAVSGTVLDPAKYFENFEGGSQPVGTVMEPNWNVKQRDYESSGNAYMAVNGTRGTETMFITPLLKVAEGDKMSVDVARTGYNTEAEDMFLKVYYSPDRTNWTLAKEIASTDLPSTRAVSSTYYYGDLKTFVIDNIPAGNYYIGFGAGYTSIDNIYGFEKVNVAHDIMVADKSMTTTGMVNNEYEATVSFKNINSAEEPKDNYTVTLYADGEPVATAEGADMAAGETVSFSLAYTPHTAGVVTMYAELKNTADDYVVRTSETDVTIVEETATAEKLIGTDSGSKENNEVFYTMYADNSKGGLCDFYYPVEMLKKYGLKAGDKIAGLKFVGTPASTKTVGQLHQTLSYGLIDEASFVAGENMDALTTVTLVDGDDVAFDENEDYITNVTLPEPIVWDGTSALRIATYVKSDKGQYVGLKYPVDADYSTAYYKSGTGSSYSNKQTPLITLNIQKDPATFSGTVKCGDDAVADATLTLRSGDVIYSGKSGADGTFSFPVIQAGKTYSLTVEAEGYEEYTEAGIDFSADVEKDIVLTATIPTGVHGVDAAESGKLDTAKPMYNLAGQKVGKGYEGIVIQNGKKYNLK